MERRGFRKANISIDQETYEWLEGVRRRLRARSVPGVIRSIIKVIHQAGATPGAAWDMMDFIGMIEDERHRAQSDEAFVSSTFDTHAEAQRHMIRQRRGIRERHG